MRIVTVEGDDLEITEVNSKQLATEIATNLGAQASEIGLSIRLEDGESKETKRVITQDEFGNDVVNYETILETLPKFVRVEYPDQYPLRDLTALINAHVPQKSDATEATEKKNTDFNEQVQATQVVQNILSRLALLEK